ncbi:MAG: copper amine oxidase N-terminal domain-containing protein, partial [Clostridiales bacterium]|nr:copper amine oxidase N-terminal domain-containing protein [Clostridiales bacterium]
MKLKNLALSVLSAAVIVTGLGASLNNTEAAEGDKVILLTGNPNALINGELKKVSEGSVPFIDQNNNTLIPIRFVSEVLSCTVGWDGGAKSITIESANKKSVLTIGKDTFVSGGATAQLSTAPVMKNGRVFVPIKDLGEKILNKKVELSKEGLIGISDAGGLFTGNETEIKALIKKINGVEVVATKEKYMELINSFINKNQIDQNETTL